MASVPGAKRAINRISLERQLLQIFKGGLTVDDLGPVVDTAEVERVPAGKVVLTEGEQGDDVYVIRSGSMVVEKDIGGKPIFLRYLPAGRSEEHTSELQSLMRTSYAVFCLTKQKTNPHQFQDTATK